MTDEQDNERHVSVPPTPIPPEWTQPKPRHGRDIWLGIFYGFLANFGSILIAVVMPFAGDIILPILLILANGITIYSAFRARRPYLAGGILLFLGIWLTWTMYVVSRARE